MTVCNSCRYCEGLCAVFPAMEMRRSFPDGDLNYLANLCHACGACYTDCQFSPPHEYNVNVPQTLAIVRAESYAAYAWPRAMAGMFARNGLAISLAGAAGVAAFILGLAAGNDHAALFGSHTGPGAFYRLMPHARWRSCSAPRCSTPSWRWRWACARSGATSASRSAWAPMPARVAAGDPGRRRTALSRWRGRRLCQRRRAADRPPQDLSSPDVLRLRAVLRRHLRRDALPLFARARGALSMVGCCPSCSARWAALAC